MKKEVFAKSKYVIMTPRKVRLVVDMIRGKNAVEAIEMLNFVNRAAALPVRKTLESALANATFNFENDKKALIVSTAYVDEAPSFKRGRAVARGRYRKIMKRNSHIVIGLREEGPKVIKEDKKATKSIKNEKKAEVKEEKVVKSEAVKKPAKAVKSSAKGGSASSGKSTKKSK